MSSCEDRSGGSRQGMRLGEILIERGLLSEQQVFEITQVQKKQPLPFGVLAERMFDVTIESIEQAWIEQYHRFTGTLDLNEVTFDDSALKLINRRQAWQFQILPVRFENDGQLLVAASRSRLARAVTFATRRIEQDVFLRIAESEQLREFLKDHFPMPEVSAELLEQARRLAG